ncbi:MAG: hypothetical protein WA113_12280 [Desulfitobacteriaceae bacterium]
MDTTNAQTKKEDAVKRLSTLTQGALSPEEIDSLLHDAVITLKQQVGRTMSQTNNAPAPEKNQIGFTPKSSASVTPVELSAVAEQPTK